MVFFRNNKEIFSSLHKVTRKYELVYNMKLEETKKLFLEANPNDFPIHDLSGNFGDEYRSIWDLDTSFLQNLELSIGHTLKINDSKVEHQGKQKGFYFRFWKWSILKLQKKKVHFTWHSVRILSRRN